MVGEAANASEANALLPKTQPDAALVDLSLKGSSGLEAIRSILSRQPDLRVFSSDIAHLVRNDAAESNPLLQNPTPREFEVLRLLVHGASAQQIATSMHLSPKTVLNYLTLIRQKLDTDNDFKLMHLAVRLGVVEFGTGALA